MRVMMGMRGIRVGMVGMQGIRVGKRIIGREMWGIGSRDERNQGENLRIEVEVVNQDCGKGQK